MTTIQKFIDNNENIKVRISRKFSQSDTDPLSETLWEGMLKEIPDEYRNLEVISEGWLMAAQINNLDVYIPEHREKSRISRLYDVLTDLETKGQTNNAAALRWAILNLERNNIQG
ncbi:MAG: hypothetical protein IJ716_11610 [Lachnospiraceae bacterium]|nr:hypothetical protein [Lachnospiraceae bacterium]